VILNLLTSHLKAHFEKYTDEHFVRRYSRRDIPDLLLQNRVLALLSSPHKDRVAFGDIENPSDQMVEALGPGGEIFKRFELVLPNRTVISRMPNGDLALDSPRLNISIGVDYHGGRYWPPSKYGEMLLDKNMWQFHGQTVKIKFNYAVKTLALLWTSGWKYYEWVDSFAAKLKDQVSEFDYFARINWPSIAIQSEILRSAQSRAKASDS
jgi:hypothetical protein